MELEAQTQAEAGQQAEARDDVELDLELLRCGLSQLPDESVDQVVQQGYRLRLAPARMGQDPARQVRHRERRTGSRGHESS